jgi:elongation of very long chain fatty acids protein 4
MKESQEKLPVEALLEPPSLLARGSCASILVAVFAVWSKYTFVGEDLSPGVMTEVHDYKVPLMLTIGYLVSLPLLKVFAKNYLSKTVDVKLLLTESMILYNVGQVMLNAWMVYKFIKALYSGHPFVGDIHSTAATYAVWVHYCDKYLEFLDTYFMVLRGKMDQVSFLHIYHHATIAWAWWAGITLWPGGDAYFGALLNSWIHVMMYSYYALSLLKIRCPWKKYLTQAQLVQFMSVLIYSVFSFRGLPQEANSKHIAALIIQDAEMISLFFLFMHFYNKAYNKRKSFKREVECSESDTSSETGQVSVSSASTDDASS